MKKSAKRPNRTKQIIIWILSVAVVISMVCSFMVYLRPQNIAATPTPAATVQPSPTPTSTPAP